MPDAVVQVCHWSGQCLSWDEASRLPFMAAPPPSLASASAVPELSSGNGWEWPSAKLVTLLAILGLTLLLALTALAVFLARHVYVPHSRRQERRRRRREGRLRRRLACELASAAGRTSGHSAAKGVSTASLGSPDSVQQCSEATVDRSVSFADQELGALPAPCSGAVDDPLSPALAQQSVWNDSRFEADR